MDFFLSPINHNMLLPGPVLPCILPPNSSLEGFGRWPGGCKSKQSFIPWLAYGPVVIFALTPRDVIETIISF